MAEGHKTSYEFGYPDERFETVLSESLLCDICSCVFKDPVMCTNEHCFCRTCLTKHLENHKSCPSCNQELSVESLADAPRILRNLLAEQKIRCDHQERGCEEIVQLGNLESHVAVCGKAPVVCSNEECSKEINREDQLQHENKECRFREVKLQSFNETGSTMTREIETTLGGLCEQVKELNTTTKDVKTGLTAVGNRFGEIENKFGGMENEFGDMKNRFNEMQSQFQKVEHFFKKEDPRFTYEQIVAEDDMGGARGEKTAAAYPSNDTRNGKNYECAYIVAGGDSVEIFDKTTNSWRNLDPMKTSRHNPSSVVYNGQFLVSGGVKKEYHYASHDVVLNTMEVLSRNTNPFVPPFWSNFPLNLPSALKEHHSIVHNDRMLVIGGYDEEKGDYSRIIYEIKIDDPYSTRILAKLPSSTLINGCGVALVNDRILIFGGRGRNRLDPTIAKVTMYDLTRKEVEELASLPYNVCNMATVKFEENVILVGGSGGAGTRHRRKDSVVVENSKNTVVKYDVETQKSAMLPPMKEERCGCRAVIDGHSLVVMGGENKEGSALDSVEAFDFRTSKWTSLPSMKRRRTEFVAEII